MSSASAAAGAAAPRRATSLRRPIAQRLALLFTLSAFVVLSLAVAVLYGAVVEDLNDDDFFYAADKVHMLEGALLRHGDNAEFLDHEVLWEGGPYDAAQHNVLYSRILDERGAVLVETPGMGALAPPALFPGPIERRRLSERSARHWRSAAGRSYLLLAASTRSGDGGPLRVIQVALDDSAEGAHQMAPLRHLSIAVVLLGTLVAGSLVLPVVRFGLAPLRDIARFAEATTATQLTRRFHADDWPAEIAPVAAAFNHMLERLDAAFARLTQYSDDLAHELRAPINNLVGEAEVTLARPRDGAEYRDVLASHLEECRRLGHLVAEMLFLAKVEGPENHLVRQRFDARGAVEQVCACHREVAEDAGVALICEGQGDVAADPTLFRRAVSNLVSNALRYTPRGGRVAVAVWEDSEGLAVAVADTGSGIAPEHLPRLFERFYRAQRPDRFDGECLGLGLAIVRSIMALHQGSATIDSTPGSGTLATLRFPPAAS